MENKLTDERKEILSIIQEYSNALELLDNYDHQVVTRPEEKEIMISVIMNFLQW